MDQAARTVYANGTNSSLFVIGSGRGGHINVLRWYDGPPWVEAARNGHFHVLRWLCENVFTEIKCTSFTAARTGRIVLVWCREQGCEELDEFTCGFAALGGQLDTLKWLRERTMPHGIILSFIRLTCMATSRCQNGPGRTVALSQTTINGDGVRKGNKVRAYRHFSIKHIST